MDIMQKEPSTIQPTAGYASAHACNLHTKQRLPKEVGRVRDRERFRRVACDRLRFWSGEL